VRPQYAGGIRLVADAFTKAIGAVSVAEMARLLKQTKYVYPYHQSLGFLLEHAGAPQEQLAHLRATPIRFKFYLDYGMKATHFDQNWKVYYPQDL
jgi:hypothetical protein